MNIRITTKEPQGEFLHIISNFPQETVLSWATQSASRWPSGGNSERANVVILLSEHNEFYLDRSKPFGLSAASAVACAADVFSINRIMAHAREHALPSPLPVASSFRPMGVMPPSICWAAQRWPIRPATRTRPPLKQQVRGNTEAFV